MWRSAQSSCAAVGATGGSPATSGRLRRCTAPADADTSRLTTCAHPFARSGALGAIPTHDETTVATAGRRQRRPRCAASSRRALAMHPAASSLLTSRRCACRTKTIRGGAWPAGRFARLERCEVMHIYVSFDPAATAAGLGGKNTDLMSLITPGEFIRGACSGAAAGAAPIAADNRLPRCAVVSRRTRALASRCLTNRRCAYASRPARCVAQGAPSSAVSGAKV